MGLGASFLVSEGNLPLTQSATPCARPAIRLQKEGSPAGSGGEGGEHSGKDCPNGGGEFFPIGPPLALRAAADPLTRERFGTKKKK